MEGRLACAGCEMGLSQPTVALKIETSRCEYLSRGWRAGNATERRGCCSGGCRRAPAGELRHLLLPSSPSGSPSYLHLNHASSWGPA